MPLFAVETAGLTALDWGVLGGYLLLLAAMGLVLRRPAGGDMESFFLAGRQLPGWLNGFSYATTCMNADVAPAYCGMTVVTGLFVCWWYVGRFGLALMIAAVLFAAMWRRLGLLTSPEFYELRFGGRPALAVRTWVAFRSAFVAVVAWTGAGLLGLHKVAEPLFGWGIGTTLAIVLPVVLFYVLLSGYLGVVLSDFFQSLVVIAKSLLLLVLVLADFGGPDGLYNAVLAARGPDAVDWRPPASHEFLGVLAVLAWTLGTAIGYGGDAAPMSGAMEGQRILSCRTDREAAKMFVWTQVVLFLLLLSLTLPAIAAGVLWPGLADGTVNKENAYGLLLAHYLPPGLLGLAASAVLASIMGTVSSNMNFGAQVFVNDVYRRSLVPEAPPGHYLFVGRLVAAGILGLGVVVAVSAENVIDIAVFMLGLSSAELAANWAQWWWWRFNGPARLAASFGGPLVFLLNRHLLFPAIAPPGPETAYLLVLVSMALTTLLWVAVAVLTPPEPMDKLVDFYRRVHPPGWWGPVAIAAGRKPRGPRPILAGLITAAIGATMTGAGVVALSCAYVGRWVECGASATVATAAAVVLRQAFRCGSRAVE